MITEVGRSSKVQVMFLRRRRRRDWRGEENDDAFRLQNTALISRFIWHEMEEELVQHSVGLSVGRRER